MGFTAVNAQGLTAPPYFLSFIVTIATTWIADKTQQRGLMIIALSSLGGIGYILLATCKAVGPRYLGCFLAASGVFPSIANILPWVLSPPHKPDPESRSNAAADNQGTDTRRGAGIVLLNLVGQVGPVLGTRLYPSGEGPRFVKGQSVCAAFLFLTALLALALRALLVWENRQLDRKHGTVEEQRRRAADGDKRALAAVGVENYGPLFRYVY